MFFEFMFYVFAFLMLFSTAFVVFFVVVPSLYQKTQRRRLEKRLIRQVQLYLKLSEEARNTKFFYNIERFRHDFE